MGPFLQVPDNRFILNCAVLVRWPWWLDRKIHFPLFSDVHSNCFSFFFFLFLFSWFLHPVNCSEVYLGLGFFSQPLSSSPLPLQQTKGGLALPDGWGWAEITVKLFLKNTPTPKCIGRVLYKRGIWSWLVSLHLFHQVHYRVVMKFEPNASVSDTLKESSWFSECRTSMIKVLWIIICITESSCPSQCGGFGNNPDEQFF